ncbi:MAG: hypothetical protein R2745_17640 [Vicinamibacterales bacterium]
MLLKGWAMDVHELGMLRPLALAMAVVGGLLGLCVAVAVGSIGGQRIGPGTTASATCAGPALLALAVGVATRTSWREFLRPRTTGHLLVVDPDSLAVEQTVAPPERCAYARTAMAPAGLDAEMAADRTGAAPADEWLVLAGDERIMRWRYRAGRLTYDASWTERYRHWGDGSFPGTGPCVYRQVVYYTDNTFPVGLTGGYRLFRKPLAGGLNQTSAELSGDEPGFMFFAVVVSPVRGDILVWDTAQGFLEARGLSDLERRWRVVIRNSDCVAVAADRDHVYVTDHDAPLSLRAWMATVSSRPRWPAIQKAFVVLDAATGQERLRVPLGAGSPVASMIVPGSDDDVFIATRAALVRVHQVPA